MAVSHIGRGRAAAGRTLRDPARHARTLPGIRTARLGGIADVGGAFAPLASATMIRTQPPIGGGRIAG